MAGPYSMSSFDDQFESLVAVQNIVEEFSWEAQHAMVLTRASVYTKSATSADAYITIVKNGLTDIVAAGPPGNRTLKVQNNFLTGIDLANIPILKGDKITVRLNVVLLNTIARCKVVLGRGILIFKPHGNPLIYD